MTLEAFIDDSLETNEVLVLAGYIAPATEWDKFSVDWKTRLDEFGWAEFKMVERVNGFPEFNGYLHRVIEKYVPHLICIAVPIKTLQSACKRVGLPYEHSLPYYFGTKALTDMLASLYREPVNFTFDEQDQISKTIERMWPTYLKNAKPYLRENMGRQPVFGKSVALMPLQAADMAAYWCRRLWLKEGNFKNAPMPFPWESKVNYPRTFMAFSEEEYVDRLLDARNAMRMMQVKMSYTFQGRDLFD